MDARRRAIAVSLAAMAFTAGVASKAARADDPAPATVHTRDLSAHADRVVFVPTAQTHPARTLYLSDYEIVVPSIGYAVSDEVQLGVTGTTDFSEVVLVDLTMKASLLRTRHLHVAAAASVDYARGEEDDFPFGRATLVAQLCADAGCRSSLSLAASLIGHDAPDTLLPLALGAGFVAAVSEDFDVLLEYGAVLEAGPSFELVDLPVYVVAYGARLEGDDSWALDLALLRPMQEDSGLRTGAPELFRFLGVPWLAFTFRFRA